jgi:hypothetical protein
LGVALAMTTCFVLVFDAAPVQARRCQAPPGTSAVDQYCETFPTVSGSRESGQLGGKRLGQTLAHSTGAAFAHAGPDGRALQSLPARSRIARSRSKSTASSAAARGSAAPGPAPPSNPVQATLSAARSATAIGSGFIVIVMGTALALVGAACIRHRRSRKGERLEH